MENFKKYILSDKASIKDALIVLDCLSGDIQTLFILNDRNQLIGTVTDGDIRRGLINGIDVTDNIKEVFFSDFKYITEDNKDVLKIREYRKNNIELLPCLNGDKQIVKVYDLKSNKSILPIDAIIMAGGKGERLRPLTLITPKPLLKVGDKCIIDYNVDALINYGLENISVTVNYLGEQLEEHYKGKRQDVQVKCVREPNFLGTMGSVKFVDSFVNDTVLVMNSDLFTNIDYEDFYLHFLQNDADMSVAAVPYSVNVPYGIFELAGRDVQGIKEKPTYNYYANAGIYLIKKKLLDLIPDNVFYNATDFLEMLIAKNHKVIRYPLTGYWIDIGKPEDYQKAQELVKHL
jgi:dTDP-glucose pyrophosphorylase